MSLPVMFSAEGFLHVTRSATSDTRGAVEWMEQDGVFEQPNDHLRCKRYTETSLGALSGRLLRLPR